MRRIARSTKRTLEAITLLEGGERLLSTRFRTGRVLRLPDTRFWPSSFRIIDEQGPDEALEAARARHPAGKKGKQV